ncbi:MAG: nucleotidyl transferase AbiEii/AbiGii toxin family protein [Flavobacteriales bacterium]|nr:nucleotidyl transferase AbiEii/AbiGii toxin family protein [Flavobacteriales bacterium]
MSIHPYLTLTEPAQRDVLTRAKGPLGLSLESIEKDIYVCLFLDKVMSLPEIGQHITFKGGTSLSKAHKITERFSEDVDLVVDRNVLRLGDDGIPGRHHSPRQQKERAKKIAKACYAWAGTTLLPALRAAIAEELPGSDWKLSLAPDSDNHETVITFSYPKLIGSSGYLLEDVKVDVVAKADMWPNAHMPIRAYIHELFPDELGDGLFQARTLNAERTLIEKALLLHEVLVQRPDGPRLRLSRHYFDLYFLHQSGVAEMAKAQADPYPAVVEHRSICYRYPGVDYEALRREGFTIIPQGAARDAWKQDYDGMQRDMFYGVVPAFDDIMTAMEQFQATFREHLQQTTTAPSSRQHEHP